MDIESFKQHFHEVDDPRQRAKVTYLFFDILFGMIWPRDHGHAVKRVKLLTEVKNDSINGP